MLWCTWARSLPSRWPATDATRSPNRAMAAARTPSRSCKTEVWSPARPSLGPSTQAGRGAQYPQQDSFIGAPDSRNRPQPPPSDRLWGRTRPPPSDKTLGRTRPPPSDRALGRTWPPPSDRAQGRTRPPPSDRAQGRAAPPPHTELLEGLSLPPSDRALGRAAPPPSHTSRGRAVLPTSTSPWGGSQPSSGTYTHSSLMPVVAS